MDRATVRGYYHARARTKDDLVKLRASAGELGIMCIKSGMPGYYDWIEAHQKIDRAVKAMQLMRKGLGPGIDIGVGFHAKTSPSVASIIVKEWRH
jgi:galactonate dehydratase